MEDLYTIRTLADLLRVSTSTIHREIREGRLTSLKIRGQIRFTKEDVSHYLASQRPRQSARKRTAAANVIPMRLKQ